MKRKNNINYFSTERFLNALMEEFRINRSVYDRACRVDEKLGVEPISLDNIISGVESFLNKSCHVGQVVDKKHKLMPYGRVCLNVGSSDSISVLEVAVSLAITYNSGQIYCYKLDNYAVNLFIITIINGVLKKFLASSYIAYQIGVAPKLVKNIFYIERSEELYFFEKPNKEPVPFEPICLLTRSKA